ncbi:MAG: sodium-dependent transporter [Acidobacteriota bacterium]
MSGSAAHFTSRWGLMLAMLGMAVGTGNIWRFPRIAASNGGGSFLVAWVAFLFLWSIPLILVEFALGKRMRQGAVGTFTAFMGEKFAWMGGWAAWIAAAIGFYYAVVMGWTIRYLLAAISGQLGDGDSARLWEDFAFTPAVLPFHLIAVVLAVAVVATGIRGIERVARVLMPCMLVLIVILAVRAVTLPGAERGLAFLFTPQWSDLANHRIWLEALTQNAWDTGAGWGLVLAYAIYTRPKEDTSLNAFLLAFGNNSISLIAGIMVLCTVFSQMPNAATEIVGAGNEGLTFVWIPQLFNTMPGGNVFMVLFFLALVFAAWTSLVSMFELTTRVLVELGIPRGRAVVVLGALVYGAGFPSALYEPVFRSQDYIWSVGLMISGLFFALAAIKFGVSRFRSELINTEDQDMHVGVWWEWVIRFVVVEAIVLVVWMIWNSRATPLWSREGLGTMFAMWGVAFIVLFMANGWIAKRVTEYRRQHIDPASPHGEPAAVDVGP